jgi:predicted nucleic acid-binding protein
VTVLDAQAVVAFLRGEPAAAEVAALLRATDAPPVISAVNEAEVLDVMVRIIGRTVDEVEQRLDWLRAGGLEVIPVDEPLARSAGYLRAVHYDRMQRPISLADCIALATALDRGDRLATSDGPLADVARREGCGVVALPDTGGSRWL